MKADDVTVSFYNSAASDYAAKFARKKPDQDLTAFINAVRPSGKVLDLGCGPGNSTAMMRDAGLDAEGSDASQAMADLAKEQFGLDIRVEDFSALDAVDRYDGIWANFSLLHAKREDFPTHLAAIKQALVPGGVFHLGLKVGSGEKRDHLDRFYTFYTVDELKAHLADAGFEIASIREAAEAGMAGTVDPFVIVLSHG